MTSLSTNQRVERWGTRPLRDRVASERHRRSPSLFRVFSFARLFITPFLSPTRLRRRRRRRRRLNDWSATGFCFFSNGRR